MINKYIGPVRQHRPGNITHNYHSPLGEVFSESFTYDFNNFGYRGEEISTDVDFPSVMVAGSCDGFGIKTPYDKTWASLLKEKLSNKYGALKLYNFSQAGAPNDYITRTILANAISLKPSLLIASLTYHCWKEYLDQDKIAHLNPDAPSESAGLFYRFYNEETAVLQLFKDISLVQYFSKANGLPYIITLAERRYVYQKGFEKNSAIKDIKENIDKKYIAPFTFNEEGADYNIGTLHKNFAEKLFHLILETHRSIFSFQTKHKGG